WTVIYETDRAPQVRFQATVDDRCTTSITNRAEISTVTPEISTENNAGEASIAVNRADLAVTYETDKSVVAPALDGPGEAFVITATLTNEGPGTAVDVDWTVQLPEGVEGDATLTPPGLPGVMGPTDDNASFAVN